MVLFSQWTCLVFYSREKQVKKVWHEQEQQSVRRCRQSDRTKFMECFFLVTKRECEGFLVSVLEESTRNLVDKSDLAEQIPILLRQYRESLGMWSFIFWSVCYRAFGRGAKLKMILLWINILCVESDWISGVRWKGSSIVWQVFAWDRRKRDNLRRVVRLTAGWVVKSSSSNKIDRKVD